jgi:cell division protein FtsB
MLGYNGIMKLFLRLLVMVVLLFSILALGKDVYDQLDKFEEIKKVEKESEKLTRQGEELEERLKDEKSPFYLEKQARDKLSYKRAGDTLYVVDVEDSREIEKKKTRENWEAWFELFFR